MTSTEPTVVLVHGAFADASSFARVIPELLADGLPVVAPAMTMRSLAGGADTGTDVFADVAKFPGIFAADVEPELAWVLAVGQRPPGRCGLRRAGLRRRDDVGRTHLDPDVRGWVSWPSGQRWPMTSPTTAASSARAIAWPLSSAAPAAATPRPCRSSCPGLVPRRSGRPATPSRPASAAWRWL